MRRPVTTVILLALACAVAAISAKQAPAPALAERIARIEGHLVPGAAAKDQAAANFTLPARMRFYNTPGVSVAVINGGVVEWARGYGVMEAGGTRHVTSRTRFQAASISKPVAAVAALKLVQDGWLALDEDVNAKLCRGRCRKTNSRNRRRSRCAGC